MALTNSYLQGVYETVQKRNPNEPEFQQAVYEVLESLEPVVEARPELEKNGMHGAHRRAGAHDHVPCTVG